MKILNLYAGIGGNRQLWSDKHSITSVEINEKIAKVYSNRFPQDKVIVGNAEEHLIKHFREYDFIWASPPCPTHSVMCFSQNKKKLPDMKLYSLILFLKSWFKGKWAVENVISYYEPLIKPTANIDRHLFWSNFLITNLIIEKKDDWYIRRAQIPQLCEQHKVNFDDFKVIEDVPEVHAGNEQFRRRQILRNCVRPELGLHILECAFKVKQKTLNEGGNFPSNEVVELTLSDSANASSKPCPHCKKVMLEAEFNIHVCPDKVYVEKLGKASDS